MYKIVRSVNLCTKNSKKGYALVKGIPYFCTVKKFTTNEFKTIIMKKTSKRISLLLRKKGFFMCTTSMLLANVMVKGTTNGTITDFEGKFTLSNVPEGAILQISYIGYQSMEIKVGNQTSFTIKLKEDSQALDEVVVVGYGSQKKVNLTGSVGDYT